MDPKNGGGRPFLPLPMLAAVLFVVLALLGAATPRAASQSGMDSTQDVAALWAQARAGQLDTETGYRTIDAIANITVEGSGFLKDIVVRFVSMPGMTFRMEGFGSILDINETRGWTGVHAYFYYTSDRELLLVWLDEA